MKLGICKLCLQEKELLNKSHIIPNSFFKLIMDDENFLYNTSNQQIRTGEGKPKKIFTGEFDSGILCKECDNNVLGKLEQYGLKVLFKGFKSKEFSQEIKNFYNPKGLNYSIVRNVDYSIFKLFLLSVLWRSSISSRNFFSDVSLGPYENKIRKMLIEFNPGDNKDFPVLIYFPNDKESNYIKLIGQPRKTKFLNKTSYVFVINGLIFIYIITKDNIGSDILDFTINKNNEFRVSHLPKNKSRDYILRFLNIK